MTQTDTKITESAPAETLLTIYMGPLAHGGACVGVVTAGPEKLIGKKAFVRYTVPGEAIEARLIEDQKNFVTAELVRKLRESTHREKPPCPWFGVCGGCDLQHMSLYAQRLAKKEMVQTMLERQAKLAIPGGVTLLGENLPGYEYRGRVSLHVDLNGNVGFYQPESNTVVAVDRCLLAGPRINEAVAILKPILSSLGQYVSSVIAEVNDDDVWVDVRGRDRPDVHHMALPDEAFDALRCQFKNLTLSYRNKVLYRQTAGLPEEPGDSGFAAGHFSQVFDVANEILKAKVFSLVNTDAVSDLYAGAGNFGLPLAKQGKQVDLVESDKVLVKRAEQLALAQGVPVDSCKIHRARCEEFVEGNELKACVILDPPRAGAKDVVAHIKPEITKRIIYIGCNLPSLCRDLRNIAARGYTLTEVSVIDMFPQTHFVESIAVMDAVGR